ncbi:MAG: M1 family metallopeptidase [Polyangiaceae bacterium]
MTRLRALLVSLGLALPAAGSGGSADPLSAPSPTPVAPDASVPPRIASYALEARLDVASHTLTGKGTLTWQNPSSVSTNELWFHLYLNAFKNEQSLFLRSPFGAGRSGSHGSDFGYIDVTRLAVRELGAENLWPRAAKTSPGDAGDETDIRLPLPREIGPGEKVNIELEWTSRLPSIVERTGYSGSFHLVGQWFPKLAKREPDGTWAHFAFHPQAEFYADFGDYDVTLNVPRGFVVGATGRRVGDREDAGRVELRYHAERVHDFAWTAWDRFRERRERVDGVDVQLLYPPGHEANAEDELEVLRDALPHMSRRYGRYPHPTLTVVHPPEAARNAGGMEYPAFITTGGPWWAARSGARAAPAVTVHELGHQWFQGLLASNEPAWPFLDEGVNTYAETQFMQTRFGTGSLFSLGGLEVSDLAARRVFAIAHGHDGAIAEPAARFATFQDLGALVYARTAVALASVANAWGTDGLDRALERYTRDQRFRHPAPKDLLDAVRAELGDDAHDTLKTALFDKGWVDYELGAVDCVGEQKPAGVFDSESGRTTVERARAADTQACRVLVRRKGTLSFPVSIELEMASGARSRAHWDGKGNWTTLDHEGSDRVVAAIVDPDREILLDENFANNSFSSRAKFAHRTLERATYLAELFLGALGP